ncbi:SEL1-like repeat protein [Minwuia thermotolerans]|uniref:Peptidoglycan binding-like domain-containing protein n=1 Tax=Minwuia thermotolerans TaxID=2056226 RepID=A0A2M9FY68_9PROT|nr:SEL1-like repeat protein [Minwuia thermotolerans]PJK28394.1 hypothetical protein CVT23_16950 [Minwuia thermotolerans]
MDQTANYIQARFARPALASVLIAGLALGGCESIVDGARDLAGGSDTADAAHQQADQTRIAQAQSHFDHGRPEQGVALLRPLADQGDAEARFLLGLAYSDGRGVPRDRARALRLFEAAAADGHADAAFLAGLAHHRGRGTAADQTEAVRYMREAAEAGHAAARYRMGLFHQTGAGVTRDPEAAAGWFRQSARQGFPEAAAAIAKAYENGVGVEKNLPWAMRWHERAAGYGVARSQFKFGVLVAAGRGMPADPETGLKWLILAEGKGIAEAPPVVDALEARLSPAAVRRAEAAARAWRPRPAGQVEPVDPATVRYVQAMLNRLGFDAGAVDGLDGPRTRAAVRAFRQSRALGGGAGIDEPVLRTLRQETA